MSSDPSALDSSRSLSSLSASHEAQIGALLSQRVRAQFRWIARGVWALLSIFCLWVFYASIGSRIGEMQEMALQDQQALSQIGLARDFIPSYIVAWDSFTMLAFTIVGIIIYWRKSNEWIGWVTSVALITAGLSIVRPGNALRYVDAVLHVPMLIVFIIGTTMLTIFIFVFPDGHFTPRALSWVAVALVVYTTAWYILPTLTNPLTWWPPPLIPLEIAAGIALGVLSQFYRYRHVSNFPQKQQTKWVIYGLTVGMIALMVFLFAVPALLPAVLRPGTSRMYYVLIGVPFLYMGTMMLPLTLAFSILRFRLWDIDLLINRTLVYVSLTAILAGLFAASITLTQRAFVGMTGQGSDWALVSTTIVIVALFTPIKDNLQALVDLRFRDRSTASKTLFAFADQVRRRVSNVHPQQITQRLLDVSVTAFGAKGGCAFLIGEGPLPLVFTSGDWDGKCIVQVSLESLPHDARLGTLELGAKIDDTPYGEREQDVLQLVAHAVALAIMQDKKNKDESIC